MTVRFKTTAVSAEGFFDRTVKLERNPKNKYKAYKETYLNTSWLAKQTLVNEVTLSSGGMAAVIDGRFELENVHALSKLAAHLKDLGNDDNGHNPKNILYNAVNDAVLVTLKEPKGRTVPATATELEKQIHQILTKHLRMGLPGGLVYQHILPKVTFTVKLKDIPNVKGLKGKQFSDYARVVLELEDAVDALKSTKQDFEHGGIGYGYERSEDAEFASDVLDKATHLSDAVIEVLDILIRNTTDLVVLVDDYLFKSIE